MVLGTKTWGPGVLIAIGCHCLQALWLTEPAKPCTHVSAHTSTLMPPALTLATPALPECL